MARPSARRVLVAASVSGAVLWAGVTGLTHASAAPTPSKAPSTRATSASPTPSGSGSTHHCPNGDRTRSG